MKRFVTALTIVLVAFAGFGAGTATATHIIPYAGPGESFSPGEGYGSAYDWICSRWDTNVFNKGPSWGLITFIDTSGNWSNTERGYGYLKRKLTSFRWSKKLHCKNNSGSTYAAGCYGVRADLQCA